jgi:twitching motility protein PilT
VLSTLHTLDATETISRIISVFPPHQQKQVRLQLGSTLRAVISQRLVPRADGRGRVAAVEVLVCNGRVREMIEDKDRTKEIPGAISQSHVSYGMQTFDQSLMMLFRQGLIAYEEALRQSSNPDDFALRVSGISGTSDSSWDGFENKPEEALPPGATPSGTPKAAVPVRTAAPVPPAARPGSSTAIGSIALVPGGTPPAGPPRNTPLPQQRVPAPSTGGAALADDDFQIERF